MINNIFNEIKVEDTDAGMNLPFTSGGFGLTAGRSKWITGKSLMARLCQLVFDKSLRLMSVRARRKMSDIHHYGS